MRGHPAGPPGRPGDRTYLSAVLLVGLTLEATLGWWWADPLAELVVAGVALNERRETWRGEHDD